MADTRGQNGPGDDPPPPEGAASGEFPAADRPGRDLAANLARVASVAAAAAAQAAGGAKPPLYRLRRLIARGGNGEVYEAYQTSLGRLVAVKRLPSESETGAARGTGASPSGTIGDGAEEIEEESMGRTRRVADAFRQEALVAAHLEHPNIVPVHDLGADRRGQPLLAMKLVRGRGWDVLIAEDFRRMAPGEFLARHLAILYDVTQAVAFAHSRGVIHRDLKPGQVMVGEFGETVLMDWGLAVRFDPAAAAARHGRAWGARLAGPSDAPSDGGGDADSPLPPPPPPPDGADFWDPSAATLLPPEVAPGVESAANPSGTPAYMAPEQTTADPSGLGPWTDVYLLGGILYCLLTGRPPHGADSSRESFRRAKSAGVVEHPERRADGRMVPAELADLAMQALAPNPGYRTPGAAAFLTAVADYRTGAGRRRESGELAERVAARLSDASGDYEALGELGGMLDTARALWPENPAGEALREQVLEETAAVAIANGDLGLARDHARRLGEGTARRRLEGRIGALAGALERRERQRRTALRGVAALATVLAVVGIIDLVATRQDARERLVTAFERAAEGQSVAFDRTVNRALDAVRSTAGLYAASDDVNQAEFREFAAALLSRGLGLKALMWVPYVAADEVGRWNAETGAAGDIPFVLHDVDEEGMRRAPARRSAHFPVAFCALAPDAAGAEGGALREWAVLGFDCNGRPDRREAMEKARDTGQEWATARTPLAPGPAAADAPSSSGKAGAAVGGAWGSGVMVFSPVYAEKVTTAGRAGRRAALTGWVAGALQPGELIDAARTAGTAAALALDLYDESAPLSDRRLVVRGTGLRDLEGDPGSDLRFESTLEVAGRRWRLVATPAEGFGADGSTASRRLPWALLAGAAVALAATGLLLADRRESRRIEQLARGGAR